MVGSDTGPGSESAHSSVVSAVLQEKELLTNLLSGGPFKGEKKGLLIYYVYDVLPTCQKRTPTHYRWL